jgi:hypothetical protein
MSDIKELIIRARELAALADKATPGPWWCDSCDGYSVVRGRGYGGDLLSDVREHPQNAKLIAAAPDMARLLGEMVDELEKSAAGSW